MQSLRALALVDRDGTLIEERDYISDPSQVALFPRAAAAMRLLASEGVARVVCSNQSGVARGFFDEAAVGRVNARMAELLVADGAGLDAIYFAPQHPEAKVARYRENLDRRKPGLGMYRQAVADHPGFARLPVVSIGDKASDVEFGEAAGGRGILVRTGYGEREAPPLAARGACVVGDVFDAARRMLADMTKAEIPSDGTLARKLHAGGDLAPVVAALKAEDRRVVLANGCFDLLHGGHVSFLESAREKGDALVLAVNSNASIARLKGAGRPILPEARRLQLLAALAAVDYLTVFYEDSVDALLAELRPSAHAKGTDYTAANVPERETSHRLGIETVIAGDPKENSTKDIIALVRERALPCP